MSDKSRLRNALDKFLRDFNWGELLSSAVKVLEENKEVEFILLLDNIVGLYIEAASNIPELKKFFQNIRSGEHQSALAGLAGLTQGLSSGMVSSVSSPLINVLNQGLNKKFPYSILDASAYIRAQQLQMASPEFLTDHFLRLGLNDGEVSVLANISAKRLDAPQLLSISHRFPDVFDNLDVEMLKQGWNAKHLGYLKLMQYQYPSVQDWILFAVREATNEQRAQQLGLDGGDYGIAAIEAEKSGLAPNYFKYYWRSHWQLPPLTLGYEWLHRFRHNTDELKFTDTDLASLIQALDYAPIWHKRMIAASYNTLTRVDIRRMLKARVIDEPRILSEYYKDGYSDPDAQALTDYAIWENQASMRDLSTAKIGEALKLGIMTELEAQLGLEELRVDPDDIPRQMALWRYEIKKAQVDADVDFQSARYMNNEIDEQTLRSELTRLGLTANNVYIAITNLNAKRKRSITPLTTSEIYQMFVENIMNAGEALTELQIRGVSRVNADRQMKLLMIRRQRETDKDLVEKQEQLEKEQAKAVVSEKAVALAVVQVNIATLQAETADLKVILPDLTDIETIEAVNKRLLAIKQEIAYLQLEKTQVNLKFAEELKTKINA